MQSLAPEELGQRRPVWDAMSDLFLDTEVRFQVAQVARVCATSPYDAQALERIFWVEVFPLAIGNLLQVAGEWGMLKLDEAALLRRARSGTMPTVKKLVSGWMVEREWRGVLAMVELLRAEPEERRAPILSAWSTFCYRYFEDPTAAQPAAKKSEVDLAPEWTRFEPIARSMLLRHERSTADARAAQVAALIAATS